MLEPVIDAEFAALIPPLTAEELSGLQNSLKQEGCRDALVIWIQGNVLLDGHNRLRICRDNGIPYTVAPLDLPDRDAAKVWIIRNQLARRNLTAIQRVELGVKLEPLVAAQAKERMLAGKADPVPKSAQGKTRDAVAQAVGLGHDTYERGKVILAKAAPEAIERLRRGESSINREYTAVRRQDIQAANAASGTPALPAGKYGVIVIDPPWPMQKIERECRPNQAAMDYPTMTEDELAALEIPAAAACHLFCWTTHRFLPMALRLLPRWGFEYCLIFVWHKPGGFQPVGLPQYNCEFVVYGRQGNPRFISTKAFPTCFTAPRGRHSEKPNAFYQMICRTTKGKRLDMFSRRKIQGFEAWGNQA